MPMREAEDFLAESEALHAALAGSDRVRWTEPTQFKGWTIEQVLRHLKFWNAMTILQLDDEPRLLATLAEVTAAPSLRAYEDGVDDETGDALLESWIAGARDAADAFAEVDPKRRLKWAGPEMSARSSMTARLMETWAHGQEIFDHLGLEREETDRVKGICFLGVQTYRWSFANRGETPPDPPPYVSLTAPSGDVWAWGDRTSPSRVEGPAVAFAQVVAQTRNIADTDLKAVGEAAERWMAVAQCFAGAPNDPPPPGNRFRR
ncbi:MAG: TIGR03084 family metal-binding protein [Paracoccaceae bacterium]